MSSFSIILTTVDCRHRHLRAGPLQPMPDLTNPSRDASKLLPSLMLHTGLAPQPPPCPSAHSLHMVLLQFLFWLIADCKFLSVMLGVSWHPSTLHWPELHRLIPVDRCRSVSPPRHHLSYTGVFLGITKVTPFCFCLERSAQPFGDVDRSR